jgi:hypothetical protein
MEANWANIPLLESCAAVSMGPLIDLPLDNSKHLSILAPTPFPPTPEIL